MTEVINIEEMYNSSEYELSDEELAQLEELYAQYEEMVNHEKQQNPARIGFCGYRCDFGCPTCTNSGYDDSDEF